MYKINKLIKYKLYVSFLDVLCFNCKSHRTWKFSLKLLNRSNAINLNVDSRFCAFAGE